MGFYLSLILGTDTGRCNSCTGVVSVIEDPLINVLPDTVILKLGNVTVFYSGVTILFCCEIKLANQSSDGSYFF